MVNKIFKIICIAALTSVMLNACTSHKPALNANEWVYKPDAINIHYVAANPLNVVNNQSHTLMLAVVQTTSLQSIQHFLQSPSGISNFLERNKNEDDSASMFVHRYYVTPGQRQMLRITRMAGMKFVTLIAAYNVLIPGQTVRIFDVPLEGHVDGILFWKKIYEPAPLNIRIHFGRQGILEAYSIQ